MVKSNPLQMKHIILTLIVLLSSISFTGKQPTHAQIGASKFKVAVMVDCEKSECEKPHGKLH